jgi:hypothetical protein
MLGSVVWTCSEKTLYDGVAGRLPRGSTPADPVAEATVRLIDGGTGRDRGTAEAMTPGRA